MTALLVALAGCGANAGEGESSRADRCTDRLLAGAESTRAARRYVRNTYCELFASRGWVYEDGALSVDAQRWVVQGGSESCESATESGQGETVRCEESNVIDCALLHHVRRSEVREYLATLGRDVECDDETLEQLGVP